MTKKTKKTKPKDISQGRWEKGVWIPKEKPPYQDYMEKAEKFDKIVELAKEENQIKSRIKQIGQERAKLIGVGVKYGRKEKN